MNITWFETASVLIEIGSQRLLFDPFLPSKQSPAPINIEDFMTDGSIFITHGHYDHLSTLPELSKLYKCKIYCTKTPYNTLKMKGVDESCIHIVSPIECIHIGNVEVVVFPGKHIDLGVSLGMMRFLSRVLQYRKELKYIFKASKGYKENNETVVYHIKSENFSVMLMGSLSLRNDVDYPMSPDILILPYQGNSHLEQLAIQIIERIEPKKVFLTHFDDTFPPISDTIPTDDFYEACKNRWPDLLILRPEYKVIYKIGEPKFIGYISHNKDSTCK